MARIKQIAKKFNIEKFGLLSVVKQKLRSFIGTGPDSQQSLLCKSSLEKENTGFLSFRLFLKT